MRPQPPPRQGDHAARKPARVELERHVDRGQAGAEQYDRVALAQPLPRLGAPRVVEIAAIGDRGGIDPRRRVRRQVAGGEDDAVGGDQAAVGETHARRLDVDHVALDQRQPVVAHRLERLGEIAAVDLPRHEAGPRPAAMIAQPAHEMLGIVGECAHPPGADVEQVARLRRAIRDATRELTGIALDHRCPRAVEAEEIDGEQRPREAAADDRDR